VALDVPRLDGGATDTHESGGVRFGHPPAEVGSTSSVAVRATSRAPDPAAGGGAEQVSEYASDFRVEVLAVDGPAPSRVRLVFTRNVHTYQGRDTPSSIDGKTYVVATATPQVSDASGSAVPEDEAQRVLDVFPDLGTRARIDQVLPERPMHVGDSRDELAAAVLRVVHPRAWTAHEARARLASVDGDEAVFAIALDASSEGGLRMKVTGEAVVRVSDSRLVRVVLDGTYEHANGDPPGRFSYRRDVKP
jgi:hypothetical protein